MTFNYYDDRKRKNTSELSEIFISLLLLTYCNTYLSAYQYEGYWNSDIEATNYITLEV